MEKRRKIKTPEEWNVKLQNMTYQSSRRNEKIERSSILGDTESEFSRTDKR